MVNSREEMKVMPNHHDADRPTVAEILARFDANRARRLGWTVEQLHEARRITAERTPEADDDDDEN